VLNQQPAVGIPVRKFYRKSFCNSSGTRQYYLAYQLQTISKKQPEKKESQNGKDGNYGILIETFPFHENTPVRASKNCVPAAAWNLRDKAAYSGRQNRHTGKGGII
jgi:hypothetical protein